MKVFNEFDIDITSIVRVEVENGKITVYDEFDTDITNYVVIKK